MKGSSGCLCSSMVGNERIVLLVSSTQSSSRALVTTTQISSWLVPGWYGLSPSIHCFSSSSRSLLIGAASLGHEIVSTLHGFPVIGPHPTRSNRPRASRKWPRSRYRPDRIALRQARGHPDGPAGDGRSVERAPGRPTGIRPSPRPQPDRPWDHRSDLCPQRGCGNFRDGHQRGPRRPWSRLRGHVAPQRPPSLRGLSSRNAEPGCNAGTSSRARRWRRLVSHLAHHDYPARAASAPRRSSAVYGQFGLVIGLVGFLFLLAKTALYGAELNPVISPPSVAAGLRSEEAHRGGQSGSVRHRAPVPSAAIIHLFVGCRMQQTKQRATSDARCTSTAFFTSCAGSNALGA